MKRFQECNKLEKIWRYRWYLIIPIQYIYYMYFKSFKVYLTEFNDGKVNHTNKYEIIKGEKLWKLLIGNAQGKMRWVYTFNDSDELIKYLKEKRNGVKLRRNETEN